MSVNLLTRSCWYGCICIFLLNSCSNEPSWVPQYNEFSNQWEQKIEVGYTLTGAYIDSAGNAWTMNQDGDVYYRPGGDSQWRKEVLPIKDVRINDIGGYGNEVWIVGEQGLILHKKANQPWVQDSSITVKSHLNGIFVYDREIWLLGNSGTILHKVGADSWIQEKSPDTNVTLTQIGGSPNNWYIVGSGSTILHNTGNGWIKESCPVENAFLTGIFVSNDDAWISVDGGILLHKEMEGDWYRENIPVSNVNFSGIYGWDGHIWIMCREGIILHKNQSQPWVKELDLSNEAELYLLCMSARGHEIWAAGTRNTVLHKVENKDWERQAVGTNPTSFFTITGNGKDMMAVGWFETIAYKSENSQWTTMRPRFPPFTPTGIYAQDDEVWVSSSQGTILHKKAEGEWQAEPTGLPDFAIKTGYRYGNEVWLAGNHGAVLYKNGNGEWLNKTTFLGKLVNIELRDIYAEKDALWVIGSHGVILHKKSGDLKFVQEYTGDQGQQFSGICAKGDELWVSGGPTMLLHKNKYAASWEVEELAFPSLRNKPDVHLDGITCHGNELWAAGNPRILLHKSGNNDWELKDLDAPGFHPYRIGGDGKNLCAIGNANESGMIVYKTSGDKWETEKIKNENLHTIIAYKGLLILTTHGFIYLKDETHNLLNVTLSQFGSVTGGAVANDKLYCINNYAVGSVSRIKQPLPVISQVKYKIVDENKPDSLELHATITMPPDCKVKLSLQNVKIDARAWHNDKNDNDPFIAIPESYRIIDSTPNSWTFAGRFEIKKNFRIVPSNDNGNKLQVRVHLSSNEQGIDEQMVLRDGEGQPFFTIAVQNLAQYEPYIVISAICLTTLLCIWWFAPIWILKLYHLRWLRSLTMVHPLVQWLANLFNSLFSLQKIVYSKRILNAWVHSNNKALCKLVEPGKLYLKLPITIKTSGEPERIESPDEELLDKLFNNKRSIIQITGQGGAGKTTLAITIAGWLLQQTQQRQIPVIVDQDITDLSGTITRKLKTKLNNTHLPESFIRMLLKKKYLVVIIDAASEKAPLTQEYLANIHSSLPVNALILTSRHTLPMRVQDIVYVEVQLLNSENLVHFITSYLRYKNHLINDPDHQLIFAETIVQSVENNSREVRITPVLVQLIIDNALASAGNYNNIDELVQAIPNHIVEVFYEYLHRVNPANSDASNYLPAYQYESVVEAMSKLALKNNFIPRAFKQRDLLQELAANADLNAHNAIQRCIDNNIISRWHDLTYYLRFNIDTLAEYVAANRIYDELAGEHHSFLGQLPEAATGFKMAFEQVIIYKSKTSGL